MSDEIVINDKKYQSIRLAVSSVLYSRDYVTRLARERKVAAVQLGRRWYVQVESLKAYAETQGQELEIRKKHLKTERLLEQNQVCVRSDQPVRSEVWTVAVLACVLVLGLFAGSQISKNISTNTNVALVPEANEVEVDKLKKYESDILRPVFSESSDVIFISQDRSIVKPVSEGYRTYSQHE